MSRTKEDRGALALGSLVFLLLTTIIITTASVLVYLGLPLYVTLPLYIPGGVLLFFTVGAYISYFMDV